MSDIKTIDMRPAPIEQAEEQLHGDGPLFGMVLVVVCAFTLGFVIGATIHRWAV